MARPPDREREDARALALADELGVQLGRLKGAGPKLRQLLSVLALDPGPPTLGALPAGARPVPFGRVKKVIEHDLDDRVGRLFSEFDEEPFALASLGQVHRARTSDGAEVAVKVQHPGAAEAVESDLRSLGVVAPLLKRLAPGLDAGAVLAEIRERVADELDYEVEAQHQRRIARRFRGHPHVRVAGVHTGLSGRRVLVTDHVRGLPAREIKHLADAERDRIGEIALRFYFRLAWQDGVIAGDPHPDNCILAADGRLCLVDFGLLREIDADYRRGEAEMRRALAAADAAGLHAGLTALGYLPQPETFDPLPLLEHLTRAGEWMLAPGVRRVDAEYVRRTLEREYPPRSPLFAAMRRMHLPPATLLLRRMELGLLTVLGELEAAADWAAIAAEYVFDAAPSTPLGRQDRAHFEP